MRSKTVNVDKFVTKLFADFKPFFAKALSEVDASARAEVVSQFTQAIGKKGKSAVKPAVVAAAAKKRGPGRPKAAQTADSAPKRGPGRPRKAISTEVKNKLVENLAKQRTDAKAPDGTPKRGPGRPRKNPQATEQTATPVVATPAT